MGWEARKIMGNLKVNVEHKIKDLEKIKIRKNILSLWEKIILWICKIKKQGIQYQKLLYISEIIYI